jgi:hypothetical protein
VKKNESAIADSAVKPNAAGQLDSAVDWMTVASDQPKTVASASDQPKRLTTASASLDGCRTMTDLLLRMTDLLLSHAEARRAQPG